MTPVASFPCLRPSGPMSSRDLPDCTSAEGSRFTNSTGSSNACPMRSPSRVRPWSWWTACWPCTATTQFRPWNPVFFYEGTSTSCIGLHIDGTLPSLSSQEPFGLRTRTLGMLPTSNVMHRTISKGHGGDNDGTNGFTSITSEAVFAANGFRSSTTLRRGFCCRCVRSNALNTL